MKIESAEEWSKRVASVYGLLHSDAIIHLEHEIRADRRRVLEMVNSALASEIRALIEEVCK